MDRDIKLMISYTFGDRSVATAREFIFDLASRLATRTRITTGDHGAYLKTVTDAPSGNAGYSTMATQQAQKAMSASILQRSVPARRKRRSLAILSCKMLAHHILNATTSKCAWVCAASRV